MQVDVNVRVSQAVVWGPCRLPEGLTALVESNAVSIVKLRLVLQDELQSPEFTS